MKATHTISRNSHFAAVLFASWLATAAGCSNASTAQDSTLGGTANAAAAAVPSGSNASAGNATAAQSPHIGESNQGGTATNVLLLESSWGRLVQVFDFDSATNQRQLVYSDVVIGASVASDGVDYEFGSNLAQQDELTILHKRSTIAFGAALAAAESLREPILANGLPPSLPPWSMVARNAAISLRFDDLLDPGTVSPATVKLFTGTPPVVPFAARVLADKNHGALADPDGNGVPAFYPTRVILDLTVSELDGASSNPPLAVNGLGLPPSVTTTEPNVVLRLPTSLAPQIGQNTLLRNPAGNSLAFLANGPNDPTSLTKDLVRAFRSGGETSVTGDLNNGVMPDSEAPRVVGELLLALSGSIVADPAVNGGFVVQNAVFNTATCFSQVEFGDLIRQGGLFGVVYGLGGQNGATLQDLKIRVLYSNTGGLTTGLAELTTAYVPGLDDADCFISYVPTAGTRPNNGVAPVMTASVKFSEPMNADTLNSFYGMTLAKTAASPALSGAMISGSAAIAASADHITFTPLVPLPHTQGVAETYHVRVGDNASAQILDVFGLSLSNPINDAEFHLNPSASTNNAGSLVLRFESTDMLFADGLDEFRGQFTLQPTEELMAPRPVARFQAAADDSNAVPAVMTPFSGGTQAPLAPLGSKLHTLWRYADLGFSLLDEANTNLDVEGLSWAPAGGSVTSDTYPEFSITLGHSKHLPDEVLNPFSLFPSYPASGLEGTFGNNFVAPGKLVHPKQTGYVVNPADLYTSSSGTQLMPYPLNQGNTGGVPSSYTWRDTALQSVGGANGNGVPFDQEILVLGLGNSKSYLPNQVPTIGLPLLMEFRCYSSNQALGLNAFKVALAANSASTPNFRAHSTGGIDSTGSVVVVDPDVATVATGGFNPSSSPPGLSTLPLDNSFYVGAVDFVTLKSRVHSIWLDTRHLAPNFQPAVVLGELPVGTQIELAYRGADSIAGGVPGQPFYIGTDAAGLDPYGDPINDPNTGTPVFFGGFSDWTSTISDINGARLIQVRISFIGNSQTTEVAQLDGLALSWAD